MAIPQSFVDAFRAKLQAATHVRIATHLNPDGDALGSALAMSLALDQHGISNSVLCNNPAPYNLRFLPKVDSVRTDGDERAADLAIVLDLNNFDRLGRARPWIEEVSDLVLIDHHVPHHTPGNLRLVDTTKPATCHLLTLVFEAMGWEITPEVATCLLTGVVTDTGSFRFRNTSAESLEIAARLLSHGGNIVQVGEEVYMKKPRASLQLQGRALEKMHLTHEDRLAWTVLDESDFAEFGALEEHTEGLTNDLLSINTVQLAAVIRKPIGGKLRASIRSREPYDVSQVAVEFGGGGHRNAAGCTYDGPIAEFEARLVKALEACLASS